MAPTTEPELVLPDCDFVVLGDTGDLALHTLIPGLYHRELERQLADGTRIIGVSRAAVDDAGYRDLVARTLFETIPDDDLEAGALHRLVNRLHHVRLDAERPDDWHLLHSMLKERDG